MRATTGLLAFAATFSSASAVFQGFNYGSTFTTGAAKQESDFEAEFKNAQNLVGAPAGGFTSARLYTMIQAGTAMDPISAIQAAINTKTSLLLGIWASAGSAVVDNEIAALKTAISRYGTAFTSLVAGISVGSEDLYRVTSTSAANGDTNPGAEPLQLAGYMKQVRDAIANTPLSSAPIGHVDTWTAWVNGSNQAVIDASDFIGVDAYPYFQNTMPNDISQNKGLFTDAVSAVQAAVGGKPIWITETGYPVSGKTVGQAVPSLANAKTYWDEVGCSILFGKVNTWWFTMQDASPDTPNPSFGVIGNALTTKPLFDLSCSNVDTSSSSSSSSASASRTASSGSSVTVSASSSGFVSSVSSAATSIVVPTSLAGGSPGVGTGLPGSQSSIEAGPTGTGTRSSPSAGSTGGSSVGGGSGSGSNTTGTFGSPTPTASPSATVVPGSGAAALSGSVAAGFLALMGAILLL